MSKEKEFDCVKFQRDVRKKMLEEANNDLLTLSKKINENMKDNELYHYFKDSIVSTQKSIRQ